MRRSERRNNLQICPHRDSITGGSDLWSNTLLPLDQRWQMFVFAVRGDSPGCCLISTASMLEWLRKLIPPPLTGEQYGKMEPKYPKSVSRHQGVYNGPFILNIPVETAAPFNVVSHQRCCEPKN